MRRALVCASLAGVAGFLVAGMFEHNFGDAEVVMLVYALMASPWVVDRELCRRAGAGARGEASRPAGGLGGRAAPDLPLPSYREASPDGVERRRRGPHGGSSS